MVHLGWSKFDIQKSYFYGMNTWFMDPMTSDSWRHISSGSKSNHVIYDVPCPSSVIGSSSNTHIKWILVFVILCSLLYSFSWFSFECGQNQWFECSVGPVVSGSIMTSHSLWITTTQTHIVFILHWILLWHPDPMISDSWRHISSGSKSNHVIYDVPCPSSVIGSSSYIHITWI